MCFTIVGNKIKYKRFELNDDSYNAVVFKFNGHLKGKFICVKCHKRVSDLVKIQNEISILQSNLARASVKVENIYEKLHFVRKVNRTADCCINELRPIVPNCTAIKGNHNMLLD